MEALLIALVPVLQLAFAGSSTMAIVLGGLTLAQWAALAGAIAGLLAPSVEAELKSHVSAIAGIHPIFGKLVADVKSVGPEKAAQNAKAASEFIAFGFEDPNNPGMFNK